MPTASDIPSGFTHAIVHIDGDAFFTSVEQSLHPKLRGKPVVTGKERGIIACASYEAKALGVKRGVSLWDARKRCPGLVVLPSDYESYSLFSKRMFEIMRRYTPDVEEYSIDEGFADLTGMERYHAKRYADIAAAMQQAINSELDLTVSVGLSLSKGLAKIASDFKKPNGLTVVAGEDIGRFLERVPLRHAARKPCQRSTCRRNGRSKPDMMLRSTESVVTATVEVLPPETESQIAQSDLSADSGVMETFGSAVAPAVYERKLLKHALFGDLRILDYKGETWYVANEVAKALKYENPHKAILDHCKGANETLVPSTGGEQLTKIINNADVFELINNRKKTVAQEFKQWVSREVLVAIDNTGEYKLPEQTVGEGVISPARKRHSSADCKGGCETRTPSPGGDPLTKIINNADVFELLRKSQLVAADELWEWVSREVLLSIDNTGEYKLADRPVLGS